MMTTLITVLTLILVAIIALWAAWPTMRSWIEQPKYDVLEQIREHEDSRVARAGAKFDSAPEA